MRTFKIFSKKTLVPKGSDLRNDTNTNEVKPVNEWINSRFGIAENDAVTKERAPKSLLFQMYSDENEALFI